MNQIVNYIQSENEPLNMLKHTTSLPMSPKSSPETEIDTQETNMRSSKADNEEMKEIKNADDLIESEH
jgi:hypothetical protein